MLRALCLGLCMATPALSSPPVTHFELDNGLEVVVIEDHRAPVTVHMMWYRAGAADETPGASGAAHFLEHLLFKATDELEAGEFSKIVASLGGQDNAFTSQDYTAYFQRIAADHLELMMKMEADRMTDISLTPDDIITERLVILEERNQRTDNDPSSLFGEQRRAAQYLAHPYGTPVIGWRHEMERLDMDHVMAFYDAHYAPNNAILIVAGDVTPQDVRGLAETYYGQIPADPGIAPRSRPQEPPQLAQRRVLFTDERVAQPYVMRSFLAPERDSGNQRQAAALTLFAELLGGNQQTSYLGRALQFETQQAIYTGAFYDGLSLDDTTLGMIIVPSPGVSLEAAEEALNEKVAAYLEAGEVDIEQLNRIKTQLRAAEIYGADNLQGLAQRYGVALTSGLTTDDVEEWPEILQSITPDEIIAAGRAVFQDETSVTGWLMAPKTEATQ